VGKIEEYDIMQWLHDGRFEGWLQLKNEQGRIQLYVKIFNYDLCTTGDKNISITDSNQDDQKFKDSCVQDSVLCFDFFRPKLVSRNWVNTPIFEKFDSLEKSNIFENIRIPKTKQMRGKRFCASCAEIGE